MPIFVHLCATKHALELHPPLRLDLQFLHKRLDRILRCHDPCRAPSRDIEHRPYIRTRTRAVNEGEQFAGVADGRAEPLCGWHVLLRMYLLRAPYPPP